MEKPTYNYQLAKNRERYTFVSISTIKRITKVVDFEEFEEISDFVHFSFGDLLPNGKVDYTQVSNNQDIELVLGTIIEILFDFLERNSQKTVIFTGSSSSRNRLYRIIIAKFYSELKDKFLIQGFIDDEIMPFESNKNFTGFLISKYS